MNEVKIIEALSGMATSFDGIEIAPACKGVFAVKLRIGALQKAIGILAGNGGKLLTMVATDEREHADGFHIRFFFQIGKDSICVINLGLEKDRQSYSSITPLFESAHWLEREVHDMFGLKAQGHPDLRPLVRHPDWPQGVFPLRKDYSCESKLGFDQEKDMEFCNVEGTGVYQIPVGPVHAGIIEPAHFRFSAYGEEVLDLQAQFFYTHRGVEKTAEGLGWADALLVAERICGVCTVSHSMSYSQAVEKIVDCTVSARADYLRVIVLELERLYNHIGDMGNMCAGIGFSIGISRGAILKERLLRINMIRFKHRYLRGFIRPGGVAFAPELSGLGEELSDILEDMRELHATMIMSNILVDRMATTGILPIDAGKALGVVGPAARSVGIDYDLRRDLSYGGYRDFDFDIPLQEEGDVLARLNQRMAETEVSVGIILQALEKMPVGEILKSIGSLSCNAFGLGWSESARGSNIHFILTDDKGLIQRYAVRSASHFNWPIVPLCVPGNIVPDFPLINKSFELCYACLDR